MGTFNGANINKLNGGLGRGSNSSDRVIALIIGMTPTAQVVAKSVHEIYDITTAESLGITAATDNNNGELVHYHLDEMTRLKPGFTYLLIPVVKTTTIAQLVADDAIKAIIRDKGVNVIGIAGIASATLDAIDADALALQALVTAFATEKRLIDGVILEGVAKTAGANTFSSLVDVFDLVTLTAPNVSVCVLQDPTQAALNAAFAKHAAVGTVLGSVAVRKIHEDLGSVDVEDKPDAQKGKETFSISDATLGRWASVALSDGTLLKSVSQATQTALTGKGYIFAGSFENYAGVYLSGCPTAVGDESDYSAFNLNCIWNKAARIIRTTLIPLVRSTVPKELDGSIQSTWITSAEDKVGKALKKGLIDTGNATAYDIYINPDQITNKTTPLSVKAQVQVGDIVHEFNVDLGLTSKIA